MTPITDINEFRHDAAMLGTLHPGDSWAAHDAFCAVSDGLPLTKEQFEIARECTERSSFSSEPFKIVLNLSGRRGGKDDLIRDKVAHRATCYDYRKVLRRGERGIISVTSADRAQSKISLDRINGAFEVSDSLASLVESRTRESIHLNNSISVAVKSCSYRTLRGITSPLMIFNECSFWRTEDGSANPDLEVYRAALPALLSIPQSQLMILTTPYARRGLVYQIFQKHFGKDDPRVLVWRAPSIRMNPTLDQAAIDQAFEEDPESSAAEYNAEFRRDVEDFISREILDVVTIPGRVELPPTTDHRFFAFTDPAGGSGADSFTLAIAHRDKDGCAVLDLAREIRPPFSPEAAAEEFAKILRQYRCTSVTGDRYAGEWPRERFRKHGIMYQLSDRPKSDIYRDCLPILTSGKAELLDLPRLRSQLLGLERRTSRAGKDSIDSGRGGHEDLANSACGALVAVAGRGRGVSGVATITGL